MEPVLFKDPGEDLGRRVKMSVRSSLKPCVHVVPSVGALLRVGAIVSQPVTNPTRTSTAASATNINSAQAYSDIQSSVPDTQALTWIAMLILAALDPTLL